MNKIKKLSLVTLTCTLGLLSTAQADNKNHKHYQRIVAMSPDVADIIVGLGGAKKVVGKNAVNRNPKLKHAKAIGMHRNLTPEAVISVKPDLALGSYMVQPQSIYKRLNSIKIKAVNVAPKEDINTFAKSIIKVGSYIDQPKKAEAMSKKWLNGMRHRPANKTRYLLSYDGRIVAGKGTVGDELIKRAGGINVAASVNGFKPFSREAWLKAKPDVIIVADHNKPIIGSKERFSRRPEVAVSPAGKSKNIHFWKANDYLRYGLSSPKVVSRLSKLGRKK